MLTPTARPPAPQGVPRCGERGTSLEAARLHGQAAVTALGYTARLEPLPADEPGAWSCTLYEHGVPVPGGFGSGKGPETATRVGAVFEALEHQLSCAPPDSELVLRGAHQVAAGPLAGDTAVALLAEVPDAPLACLPYHPLNGAAGQKGTDVGEAEGERVLVPVFLSTPDYLDQGEPARAVAGDTFDYTAVGRYSVNSGWAAGTTPAEAAVHALNEIIERDATSLLLAGQFLRRKPAPLRVVDPATLPPTLSTLHTTAQDRLGQPVRLLEMTTGIGVPAYWAWTRADRPGAPARLRGCGASLSARYAAERALSELIQCHSGHSSATDPREETRDHTSSYPALHRCHLADFSTRLPHATSVPFTDTEAPSTPGHHLAALQGKLADAGITAWVREHYVTEHLAVLNLLAPGMERFMLITDGQLVLPGPRARFA